MRPALAAFVLIVAGAGQAAAADGAKAMVRAADDFFAVYAKLSVGGVPTSDERAKLEPVVSPALSRLLADADAAEAAYAVATKGEVPPLHQGDVFTSLFEGATTFKIAGCTAKGMAGQCAVDLSYDDAMSNPVAWTDKVDLVKVAQGWRVDDVVYGGTWDFGNKGRLSDLLKAIVAEAKKPVE